jgi:hypothetical protein
VVSTIVGVAGQASFKAGALPGLLAYPVGVAISGTSLYITTSNGVAVVQNPNPRSNERAPLTRNLEQ